MLIFIYGPDKYRLKQGLGQIVGSYKKKHSSGVNIFDFDFSARDADVSKLEDAVKSMAFFAEVKLVIARETFTSAELTKSVDTLIKEQRLEDAKDVVFLLCENQDKKALAAKNKKLFTLLTNKAKPVRSYEFLSGVKLEQWIKAEFEARGTSITADVARSLMELVGNDSWSLINEIDKLSNYKSSLAVADVKNLVSPKTEQNIFKFTDALSEGHKSKSFELLFRELTSGREAHYLFSMMVYQFRNLLVVKDLATRGLNTAAIQQKAKLHPFVAQKLVAAAQKFSLVDLKTKYQKLCELDVAFKEGRADLEDSLYTFVLS